MVHELLGIDRNRVSLAGAPSIAQQPELKEVCLSCVSVCYMERCVRLREVCPSGVSPVCVCYFEICVLLSLHLAFSSYSSSSPTTADPPTNPCVSMH